MKALSFKSNNFFNSINVIFVYNIYIFIHLLDCPSLSSVR